jgi:hypothetical protein
MVLGLVFAVTLAIVVGQRLSAEGMAVVIGVIAGVVASIPTSLIVVWFTSRAALPRQVIDATPARAAEPAEPRIVVMAQPPQPPTYQTHTAYPGQYPAGQPQYPGGPQSLGNYAYPSLPPAYPPQTALPPRRFTVVGGGELAAEPEYTEEEVLWER